MINIGYSVWNNTSLGCKKSTIMPFPVMILHDVIVILMVMSGKGQQLKISCLANTGDVDRCAFSLR